MASLGTYFYLASTEDRDDEEQGAEETPEEEKEAKALHGGRRATLVVCCSFLFALLGFNIAMTADGTALFREVPMPNPRKVWKDLTHGDFSAITNSTDFQSMPEPYPSDLDKLPPKEKAQRTIYWTTLLSCKLVALVSVGTVVLQVPIPSCLGGDAEDQLLSPEQWTMMVCFTMCPFVIYTVVLTFKAASCKLLSTQSGLGWEMWNSLFDVGAGGLLAQAVGVRILRPRAKYEVTAFAKGVFASMTPMIGDPFDTSKDSSFAGLAWSYGTPFAQAISLASYTWLCGLHFYMMVNTRLQLELRASYLPILSLVPLRESAEGGVPARKGSLPTFRSLVLLVLTKLLMQARPSKQEVLKTEDVPQGIMASVYMGYLWHQGQPVAWVVLLLNIVIPLGRILAAWLAFGPLAWWCYAWILKQFLTNEGAGHEQNALEFRELALHVRKMRGGEAYHRQTLEVLRLEAFDLGLDAANKALIFQFFKALKEKEQSAALQGGRDLLFSCVLEPASFGMAWAESDKPAVDVAFFGEVLAALSADAVKLFCPLETASLPEAWCGHFQGAMRFLARLAEINKGSLATIYSEVLAAIRAKEAEIGRPMSEELKKRCRGGMSPFEYWAKSENKTLEAGELLTSFFHPRALLAGSDGRTPEDEYAFGLWLEELGKKMDVDRLELVATGRLKPQAEDTLYYAGPDHTYESGNRLSFGALGTVLGPAPAEWKGQALSMFFWGNEGASNVLLSELSATKPEMPEGYSIGDQLYYTGTSYTFGSGNQLTFGALGTVMGPATHDSVQGQGLTMGFDGNKGMVEVLFRDLSTTKPKMPAGSKAK